MLQALGRCSETNILIILKQTGKLESQSPSKECEGLERSYYWCFYSFQPFGETRGLTGRCWIIRKIKQMALANHASPFPQVPGIPTLRLSSTYACLIKLLPFQANRACVIQARSELWISSIIHIGPECWANTFLSPMSLIPTTTGSNEMPHDSEEENACVSVAVSRVQHTVRGIWYPVWSCDQNQPSLKSLHGANR